MQCYDPHDDEGDEAEVARNRRTGWLAVTAAFVVLVLFTSALWMIARTADKIDRLHADIQLRNAIAIEVPPVSIMIDEPAESKR